MLSCVLTRNTKLRHWIGFLSINPVIFQIINVSCLVVVIWYNTNCLNYAKETEFLSIYDCNDEYFIHSTIEWNIIPGMVPIDRNKYNTSALDIFPADLMEEEDFQVIEKKLKENRTFACLTVVRERIGNVLCT